MNNTRLAVFVAMMAIIALGAYLETPPVKPVHFVDFEDDKKPRVVEWTYGKYEVWQNGNEKITPYWGLVSLWLDPGRGNCPQGITVQGKQMITQTCLDGKPRVRLGETKDMPMKERLLLDRGRRLAKEHWSKVVYF